MIPRDPQGHRTLQKLFTIVFAIGLAIVGVGIIVGIFDQANQEQSK